MLDPGLSEEGPVSVDFETTTEIIVVHKKCMQKEGIGRLKRAESFRY